MAQPADTGVYQPAVPAPAPTEMTGDRGIDKRLERDEKALRELRGIVLQAKASGSPVSVRDAGPDPQLADIESKLDDLDHTLSRLNAQVETVTHDLDGVRRAVADANDANKALSARLDRLEAQLQGGAQPQAGGAPPQTGVLGQLPVQGPAPQASTADQGAAPAVADEVLAYRQARQVLDSGDYAGGAAALQDYLARFPASPRAPEANYWLGRTLALQNMHVEAAAAYARSLKGWPQTAWAGDALVRLSGSLIELKRADDACRALDEFGARYAAKATPALRVRAKETRNRAACA
jgi:tol-pal system protein YbgF